MPSRRPCVLALQVAVQVHLPWKFVEEAEALGKAPDMLYCIKMLEAGGMHLFCQCLQATGVIVVPGSGFAQRWVRNEWIHL